MEQIYRTLADIHNKIEGEILSIIRPGLNIYELCLFIERQIAIETNNPRGIAFPVGININNCAAHYSPTATSSHQVFLLDDVVKIDYGIHIDGHILDAAFTVAFKRQYRGLLEASMNACMEGAKSFCKDKRLIEVSQKIVQTVPKEYGIIRDLCGHQIKPYKIHGGKVVPNVIIPYEMRASVGEIYTVEPFISTTKEPITYEDTTIGNTSHYMYNYFSKPFDGSNGVISLLKTLKSYSTLAFNIRWIPETEQKYIDKLVDKKIYNIYPPIYEKAIDAKIAQFETTLMVTDTEPILFKEYTDVDKYIILNS
jgi:methionyl aminopeptidase